MKTIIINTNSAPAPIGPYNQAVWAGNMLFVSGQIALIPDTDQLNNSTIEKEAQQVMDNIKAILKEGGLKLRHVVKTTIFLSDMSLFGAVNEVYAGYFTGNYPARETVAVKGLPKNVNVEISVIAMKNKSNSKV